MKFNGKFVAVVLILGLGAAFLASVPVMAQAIYGGDNVGYRSQQTVSKPINESLRAGIHGGDQVGVLGPAPGERLCNMNPKDAGSCYAAMPCGPKGQQCASIREQKDRCSM
ncbi:MAG: hypothetical protein C4567_11805 [Deltaproteobacteria bacterium]|nr:MAG: hypothetical protein C4567_11805 [Deltaproteobacteria bacterium]